MDAGAPPPSTDDLLPLASARFGNLSPAEVKLLAAVRRGELAVCGATADNADPANDPRKADNWPTDRDIRADLIRWLCVDHAAKDLVDPKGIQVYGARIIGGVDLSYVTVPFGLTLRRCRLGNPANLASADVTTLDFQGTWLTALIADNAKIKGAALFGNGFRTSGELRLMGAKIGGDLDCSGATLVNPSQWQSADTGIALSADAIEVAGSIFLRQIHAEGAVRLPGGQVGGTLDCSDATIHNSPQLGLPHAGMALIADRLVVKGTVFVNNGFDAAGAVRLLGARIGSDLDCGGARLANAAQPGVPGGGGALIADSADVAGSVFLNRGFHAEGEVRLLGARIGGALDCSGVTLVNPSKGQSAGTGIALNADSADVAGSVFLNRGFHAEGEVRLLGARIGGQLNCFGASIHGTLIAETTRVAGLLFWIGIVGPEEAQMNLTNASAGGLVDDPESWPPPGMLLLDGFVYERIVSGPRDAVTRLGWLVRQQSFAPQPYRQLAKVLKDEGDDKGARFVLFERERLRRRREDGTPLARAWSLILRWTIGFGYYPGRALAWLLGLTLAGLLLFSGGLALGSLAPTDKDAYAVFKQTGRLPPQYEQFNALVYSFESSFPFVKLGQTDRWQPDPDPRWNCPAAGASHQGLCWIASPERLRLFRWLQICLGWFFATMGVVGLTGVIRKE